MRSFALTAPGAFVLDPRLGGRVTGTQYTDDPVRIALLLQHGFVEGQPLDPEPAAEPVAPPVVDAEEEKAKTPPKHVAKAKAPGKVKKAARAPNHPDDGEGAGAVDADDEPDTDEGASDGAEGEDR